MVKAVELNMEAKKRDVVQVSRKQLQEQERNQRTKSK